jgi:hypothetical protein
MCVDTEVRRQLEAIAARRGVGTPALLRQIIQEWIAAQHQPAPAPPDQLVELTRHLEAARRVAATLAHQTASGAAAATADDVVAADGIVAAEGAGIAGA